MRNFILRCSYVGSAIDLVICDEGHKLKNNNIKTSQAIARLKTTRRIILSGTPIQNDLEEFYAMVNFVNPSVLGEFSAFKKVKDAHCYYFINADMGRTNFSKQRPRSYTRRKGNWGSSLKRTNKNYCTIHIEKVFNNQSEILASYDRVYCILQVNVLF